MQFYKIETSRLYLRQYSPEVARHVLSSFSLPGLKTFYGTDKDEDVLFEKAKLQKGLSTFNRTFLYFHLIEKTTGMVMGWCGYHTWYTDHDRAEIGYILFKDEHKGKGYLSEAIQPILDYGFHVMNLGRIEAMVGPFNTPSLKIIKRMGFVQEGLLREHYKKENRMEDSLIFSLLKKEYVSLPATSDF